ncbi:hypothetical protein [Streptomyces flaveolus]|uniref:hypothetical protein n=1 Tax=Streptomyces flaveolus TaxID=67297 RepID=UPI0037021613
MSDEPQLSELLSVTSKEDALAASAALALAPEVHQAVDEAAREMNLYSSVLDKPHLTSADLCRRHIAAASESDDTHAE